MTIVGDLKAEREAPQLLNDVLGSDDRYRPADVLCIPALTLARELPDGSRAVRTERVCFDFGNINGLGQGHWANTATVGGLAADSYDEQKRRRNQTEQRYREVGLQYRPVIHETQGGMSKGADAAMRAITQTVAANEHKSVSSVRSEMQSRIAVMLARCNAHAIRQRRSKAQGTAQPWAIKAQLRLGPLEE